MLIIFCSFGSKNTTNLKLSGFFDLVPFILKVVSVYLNSCLSYFRNFSIFLLISEDCVHFCYSISDNLNFLLKYINAVIY